MWPRRRILTDRRYLVTGATSGIGRALAVRLAAAGARLLVTGRRADRLDELVAQLTATGAEVVARAGDVTDPQLRQRLVSDASRHFQGLDGLINNAGLGAVGPFATATEHRLRQVMEVNFFAPAELIRLTLPLLTTGRQPLIVNVGSVLGHVAVPKKSEYCASKFALRGLSDALGCELMSAGVEVLWVAPNTTRSEFFDNLLESQGTVARNPWSRTPDQVARRIVRAMRCRRSQLILTCSGRNLVRLNRWFPRLMRRALSRWG